MSVWTRDVPDTIMSHEQSGADLNSLPSMRFHSVEEAEEAMKGMGFSIYELRQLGRGSFHSDLMAIRTSEGLALSQRFERSFSLPLHAPDRMVSLILPNSARGDLFASGDVVNGKLVVQSPQTEVDVIAPDLTGAEAICVPVSRFYSLLETICPGGPVFRPGQMVAVAGDKTRLYDLRRAIHALVTHPDLDPCHERHANLIAKVIAWMGDSSSQWRPQGFSVNGARIQIARRARDYMEDHFRDPIRLADICRELRVSLRTMQRAFVEYFQVSPYEFFKKLRLDRARRELLAGEPDVHSVTTIALNHGFRHFSRFSRDYRETFGELPRETLARS